MWCNTRQLHVLHYKGCITPHQFLHHISFYNICISLLHVILRRKLNLERKQRSERMQECKTEKTSRGEQDRHARSGRASASRGTQSWAASFQAIGHTSRACEHTRRYAIASWEHASAASLQEHVHRLMRGRMHVNTFEHERYRDNVQRECEAACITSTIPCFTLANVL